MCMHSTQSLSDGAEAGTRPIRRRGRADHVGAGCGAVSLTQQATGEHAYCPQTHAKLQESRGVLLGKLLPCRRRGPL